jgi:predicted Zn-dependent peptidase
VAAWAGGQEILTGRVLGVDQIIGIIDAITSEELRQLACELLVGKHLRLALVGPVTKEDSLEELLKL